MRSRVIRKLARPDASSRSRERQHQSGSEACRVGLFYRWYAKEHGGVIRLLSDLTAGRFRDGAVARVLAMGFWTRGEAPTLAEFARAWTDAKADEHRLLTPEYAYLTDLKHQRAGDDWKALRSARAKSALKTLARIAPVRRAPAV